MDEWLDGFDSDLQTFYRGVVDRELDLCRTAEGVRHALREVVRGYKKETVSAAASTLHFDSPEKRAAYLLKHGPCFSSAVAAHFARAARAHAPILEGALGRRHITLCCLGGGPGTEAVGVARALGAAQGAVRGGRPLTLTVWVVDRSAEWCGTAQRVVQALTEEGEFCDRQRMCVELGFLGADLSRPWGSRVREVVASADLVTMVYFVSAVDGSPDKDKCPDMLRTILEALKPGAMLFFLDSAKELHYDAVQCAVSSFRDLRPIYGPHEQLFHTLSFRSIRKFIELYSAQFGALLCLTNCFITCCCWTKKAAGTGDVDRPMPGQDGTRKRGPKWGKRVARNTRRQARFRERVERLLLSELHMDFATDDLIDRDAADFEPDWPDCEGKVFYASKSKRKRIYVWRE